MKIYHCKASSMQKELIGNMIEVIKQLPQQTYIVMSATANQAEKNLITALNQVYPVMQNGNGYVDTLQGIVSPKVKNNDILILYEASQTTQEQNNQTIQSIHSITEILQKNQASSVEVVIIK